MLPLPLPTARSRPESETTDRFSCSVSGRRLTCPSSPQGPLLGGLTDLGRHGGPPPPPLPPHSPPEQTGYGAAHPVMAAPHTPPSTLPHAVWDMVYGAAPPPPPQHRVTPPSQPQTAVKQQVRRQHRGRFVVRHQRKRRGFVCKCWRDY